MFWLIINPEKVSARIFFEFNRRLYEIEAKVLENGRVDYIEEASFNSAPVYNTTRIPTNLLLEFIV